MRRVLLVFAIAVVTVAAVIAMHLHRQERNGNSTAPGVAAPRPRTPKRDHRPARRLSFSWPTYGRDSARTHAAPFPLRPPFRRLWAVHGDSSFIEFPPIVVGQRLFFATDQGRVAAIDARDGSTLWKRELRRCIAASLAGVGDVVFVGAMGPPPCNRGRGQLVALDTATGTPHWRFHAGPIESSPLVVDGRVIFGSWDGKLYALSVRSGRPLWRFSTGGPIKGGAALAHGTVYFASYDGRVYAVASRTGQLRWRADPPGSNAFYATPTVAHGRVFVGATNGTMYAFAAGSGRRLWSRSLGRFVYSPAAVAEGRVYVGSYDHRLYALDAPSGSVVWSFESRGPVSGAPTVLGRLVYFSSCGSCSKYESNPAARRTYAVDRRTGQLVWSFPDGEYSPVVSDGTRVYVTGYTTVYGLVPRGS